VIEPLKQAKDSNLGGLQQIGTIYIKLVEFSLMGDCKKHLDYLLHFHDFFKSTLKLEKLLFFNLKNRTNVYTFKTKVTTKRNA